MNRFMIHVLILTSSWFTTVLAMECVDYRDHLHRIGTVELGDSATQIILVGDHAIVPSPSGLQVFDIADPRSMFRVGGCDWASFYASSMETAAGFLYVSGRGYGSKLGNARTVSDNLTVFDIADVTNPVLMTSIELASHPTSMAIANGHLYLTLIDRLCIYSLDNPAEPTLVTEYFDHCNNYVLGITIEGNLAYMVNGMPQLAILDVSDPVRPRYLGGAYGTGRDMQDVCIKGDYAYVAVGDDGVAVFDVSDPYAPVRTDVVRLTSQCHHVKVNGDYVYASTNYSYDSGLWVLDASYGIQPHVVNYTALSTIPHDFEFLGDRVFVVTFAHSQGSFLESVDIAVPESVPGGHEWDLGAMAYSAVAYHEPYVFTSGFDDGHEYLISARVTTAGVLWPVERCEVQYGAVDIALCGDYIYASCRGVTIVEADDSGHLHPVGNVQFGPPVLGTGQIVIRGEYAYVVTIPGGIHILDVSEPTSPTILGMRCGGENITAMKIVGDRIYLARGGTAGVGEIEIWQLDDPLQPQLLGAYSVGNYVRDLDVSNQRLYATTGNTLRDQLLVFDITHPDSPQLLSSLLGMIGDVTVTDGIAYVACVNELIIVDIRNDYSPEQIGSLRYGEIDMVLADNFIFMSNNSGLVVAPRQCALEQWTTVPIDIRPGSETNVINCVGGHGLIPVAILTTPEFDALEIDHATVRFGPAGASEAHGTPGRLRRHEIDVDGDLDLDLLFHFRNGETGIQCGDSTAGLTGFTFDGGSIRGADTIRTVPDPKVDEADTSRSIVPAATGSENQFRYATGCGPNPFNPSTMIWYIAEEPAHVSLEIYSLTGRRVALLLDGIEVPAGYHEVAWDGRDEMGRYVPTGTYVYRLRAGEYLDSGRMTLIK